MKRKVYYTPGLALTLWILLDIIGIAILILAIVISPLFIAFSIVSLLIFIPCTIVAIKDIKVAVEKFPPLFHLKAENLPGDIEIKR